MSQSSDLDRQAIRQAMSPTDTTLVLISETALVGQSVNLASTAHLRYLGAYPCNL